MGKFIDLTGQRFGKLTVIKRTNNGKNNQVIWICRCDCGNVICVSTNRLRMGNTRSCGCLKHSLKPNLKHGKHGSRLYNIWQGMKQRCSNTNSIKYQNYGGRGVKVCDEWKNDFMAFYNWAIENGYDENKPRKEQTLDRINNDGNYEPNNCRWVTHSKNCRNKNNNILLTRDGVTKTIAEWCEELNLNKKNIYVRAKKYQKVDEILSQENLLNKKHISNTNEFGITKTKNNKFILYIKHKYIGQYKTLEEAIIKRGEILK